MKKPKNDNKKVSSVNQQIADLKSQITKLESKKIDDLILTTKEMQFFKSLKDFGLNYPNSFNSLKKLKSDLNHAVVVRGYELRKTKTEMRHLQADLVVLRKNLLAYAKSAKSLHKKLDQFNRVEINILKRHNQN